MTRPRRKLLERLSPVHQRYASYVSYAVLTLADMPPRPRLSPSFFNHATRRTMIAAPRPGSGPLMERRADRALPSIASNYNRGWLKTMPIFAVVMIASTLAIFNYQKSTSSVVSSTMYALRTSAEARELLGDEIYFASQIPWIRGEINQLHGRIDISIWVKGTKRKGLMKFKSVRKTRAGYFETLAWTLEPEGGEVVSLLQAEGRDPFVQETADRIAVVA